MTQPAMVVLRPGDKVLITLTDEAPEPEALKQIAADLKAAFPGVEFVLMSGVAGIAVQSP